MEFELNGWKVKAALIALLVVVVRLDDLWSTVVG